MCRSFKIVMDRIKHVSCLKLIMCVRLLFGLYYNITSSRAISCLLRLYCISVVVFTIIGRLRVWTLWSPMFLATFEYIFSILFSQYTADEFLFKFLNSFKISDTIMGYKGISTPPPYFFILFWTNILFRTIVTFVIYAMVVNKINEFTFWSITSMYITVDLNFFTAIIVLSSLHSRMRLLRSTWEANRVSVIIVGRNDIAKSIRHIRKCLFYYNHLLDNFQLINMEFQYMLSIVVIVTMPRTVVHAYNSLLYLKTVGSDVIELLIFSIKVLSPAIIVELILYEVDKIKKIIFNQILMCTDASLRMELEIALEYLTLRPFRCVIWRVIPVNITLPVTFFTVTITYVIILAQLIRY